MNNKKIIQTIEKIDSLMKDPKNLDVYIKFYNEVLTEAYSINNVNNIDKLYCHFNQNSNEISIKTQRPSSNDIFFIRMDTDLIELFQSDDDCYIAARDFLAMPAYKKRDRLEALTFIAERGLESFKTINEQVTKFTDIHILDYVYNHKLSFSILDFKEKLEVASRWLEQIQPNNPKEFFETLESFDNIKEKILNFEVNTKSIYDKKLRPIYLLQRMMEKNLISKSIYLTKVSEFCELNKNSLTKDDIGIILIWICNTPIFKNPNMGTYYPSDYTKEQLTNVPKDVLITFSKTIDDLKQLSPNDENIANKILKPINEVLEK
jgi:hypothetical protein